MPLRPVTIARWICVPLLTLSVCSAAMVVAEPEAEPGPAAIYALRTETRELDRALDRLVEEQGLGRLVARGDLAIALVDLSREEPRYAGVNDDRMIYAASLPKIAILLGAFEALDEGLIGDTPALQQQLTEMIRFSSNAAASEVLQRIGFETVAQAVTDPRHGLYEAGIGGLWVGKAYGRNDYWRRDPVAQLSHGATARQAARFFVLLQKGLLVSPEASARMKTILGDPGTRHKFVRGLEARPGARIYRKSGTWRDFHADGALIERDGSTYVAVGLVRSPEGAAILERLIVGLDDLVSGAADQRRD